MGILNKIKKRVTNKKWNSKKAFSISSQRKLTFHQNSQDMFPNIIQEPCQPHLVSILKPLLNQTGSHTHTAAGATFGLPKGQAKPDPGTFRLKNTGTIQIPVSTKYSRAGAKKVDVPLAGDKPIMGLVSDKNFIVSNAVENILAAPKIPTNKNVDHLKKKNYGKVPKYLQTIKKEIEDEYQLVREMQIEDEAEMDRQKFLINDDEKQELITALKKKWEVVHKQYQTLTHKNKLDTLGLKEKYERCERELNQLEKDIAKLSKNYIFVDTTQPSTFF